MKKCPLRIQRPDQNLVTAAFSLSGAVYVAETLAQQLFASSVFDAYDVYFWIGLLRTAQEPDFRLAKRVTLLPTPKMKSFWGARVFQAEQHQIRGRGTLMRVFEEQMKDSSGAMPVPVTVGRASPYSMFEEQWKKGMPPPVIVGPGSPCKGPHNAKAQVVRMAILAKGRCSYCGTPKTDRTMKCSCGCAYCSKKCQRDHWHVHRQMEH